MGENIWLRECPFDDQGLLRPMVASDTRVVLLCDTCNCAWLHPDDVDGQNFYKPEDRNGWLVEGSTTIVPGTTRWASREDVAALNWGVDFRTY